MREINGTLRGLLKKSNLTAAAAASATTPAAAAAAGIPALVPAPPNRKNRVVFDETKNEFFEADYIILIREDCGYSEEDEEPCNCGDHELVRICCEEGCHCSYSEDSVGGVPPQVCIPHKTNKKSSVCFFILIDL